MVTDLVIRIVERLHDTLALFHGVEVVGQGLADATELIKGFFLPIERFKRIAGLEWTELTI